MENKYRQTNGTVSLVQYHLVFCPRYKRKIFLIPGLKERFMELVSKRCFQLNIDHPIFVCGDNYVYVQVESPPHLSPWDVVRQLKSHTGKIIISEYPQLSKMPGLWTKKYFVSTEAELSDDVIQDYVLSLR